MKEDWYKLIDFGFADDPTKMWHDRHVRVTIGERKVGKVYYIFNEQPDFDKFYGLEKDIDFSVQIIDTAKSFKDIELRSHILLGVCGNFEIVKSSVENEFKIEFF
jgi:hypothetical protein